ncbi:MAG: hypothetical protein R2838_20000 [Caldilineaceae bacterium]
MTTQSRPKKLISRPALGRHPRSQRAKNPSATAIPARSTSGGAATFPLAAARAVIFSQMVATISTWTSCSTPQPGARPSRCTRPGFSAGARADELEQG